MQSVFPTMEQKRKCEFYLCKNHRKKHTACNWCQKDQEQEITKKWQVELCEDNIVILLWSRSQFPNPESSESSFRCWIHLSLKATKRTHIYHLLIFGMLFLMGAFLSFLRFFCSSGPKSWTQKTAHKGYMWKPYQSKINRLGAWDLPVRQDFWECQSPTPNFFMKHQTPTSPTPQGLVHAQTWEELTLPFSKASVILVHVLQ